MATEHRSNVSVCRCGGTTVELIGEPIESVICHCESCRTAGRGFERDVGAPPTLDAVGGVAYCLYRKDRVKITGGAAHLREYSLKANSPTRRVLANCCASPMFLDFTPGHWLSVFRGSLSEPAPEPKFHIMARDRPGGSALSGAIPAYDAQPPRLMFKLLAAWVAMGLRRPKITW